MCDRPLAVMLSRAVANDRGQHGFDCDHTHARGSKIEDIRWGRVAKEKSRMDGAGVNVVVDLPLDASVDSRRQWQGFNRFWVPGYKICDILRPLHAVMEGTAGLFVVFD